MIAGAVIGSIAGVVLVIIIIFLLYRQRKLMQRVAESTHELSESTHSPETILEPKAIQYEMSPKLQDTTQDSTKFETSSKSTSSMELTDITITEQIGGGHFGAVYRGMWGVRFRFTR